MAAEKSQKIKDSFRLGEVVKIDLNKSVTIDPQGEDFSIRLESITSSGFPKVTGKMEEISKPVFSLEIISAKTNHPEHFNISMRYKFIRYSECIIELLDYDDDSIYIRITHVKEHY